MGGYQASECQGAAGRVEAAATLGVVAAVEVEPEQVWVLLFCTWPADSLSPPADKIM